MTWPEPTTAARVEAHGKQVRAQVVVQFKAQVRRRSRVIALRVKL
jgi:hypothetical protein